MPLAGLVFAIKFWSEIGKTHLLGQQKKAVVDAAPPGATEHLTADLAALKTQARRLRDEVAPGN